MQSYVIPKLHILHNIVFTKSPKFLQLKPVLWYTVYIDTGTKFNILIIIPAAHYNKEKWQGLADTHTDCTVVLDRSHC